MGTGGTGKILVKLLKFKECKTPSGWCRECGLLLGSDVFRCASMKCVQIDALHLSPSVIELSLSILQKTQHQALCDVASSFPHVFAAGISEARIIQHGGIHGDGGEFAGTEYVLHHCSTIEQQTQCRSGVAHMALVQRRFTAGGDIIMDTLQSLTKLHADAASRGLQQHTGMANHTIRLQTICCNDSSTTGRPQSEANAQTDHYPIYCLPFPGGRCPACTTCAVRPP